MKTHPKIIVVMPAHNAAKTIKDAYKRLPHTYIDQVILVDDASTDDTYSVAKKLPVKVFRNTLNLGYGGNLKVCLTKALEFGADIIIEYHPDNQYDPKYLPDFLTKAKAGFDFALGSRFIHPKEALDRHMPLVKFMANRGLTFIDQFVLGIELSEFHSGFRLYTRKLLQSVPFLQNSDDYLFSFEIIVQAIFYKFKVAEVQISCDYHPQMHTANLQKSTIYALGTFKTLTQYVVSKFGGKPVGPFRKVRSPMCPLCQHLLTRREYAVFDAVSKKDFLIFWCTPCQTAFTLKPPKNLSAYYPSTYYSPIKTFIYQLLQYRRPQILRKLIKKGVILDVGCGDGEIGYTLTSEGWTYTGIETPFAKIKNPLVKMVGVENIKEKPAYFDIVTLWESFEHLAYPQKIVKKMYKLLKKNGYIVIECPNYTSWERFLFFARWFHLDPPRHLFHYTPKGLQKLLTENGFTNIQSKSVFAPEYIPVGLALSVLYVFSPHNHIIAQSKTSLKSIVTIIVFLSLTCLFIPISYLFYLLNGSPIQLLIARKNKLRTK